MKELLQIQSELKAPKGQFNAYGKYKYRSCEDIWRQLNLFLKSATAHYCYPIRWFI